MNILVDDIGKVVALMRGNVVFDASFDESFRGQIPYYMYGHRKEINNRLIKMSKDSKLKYQKYPLIALKLDSVETISNGIIQYNLNLVILYKTEENDDAYERYEKVFKTILYPLYYRFFEKLRDSGLFTWNGGKMPDHIKIDRPYWGTETLEGNDKNVFTDPLDAIEILNLKISQTYKC